jgi:ribulose-bisphosphate carboxylase large chain
LSLPNPELHLSGERFTVTYLLQGDEVQAAATAQHICVEETIEFPAQLLADGDILNQLVGRIEQLEAVESRAWRATISFAAELAGDDLLQVLNVIYGNISMASGILVERVDLCPTLLARFRGPRFGRRGLRERLGVPERPLLCTALKPMGLSAGQLAEQAYTFALGGIDLIKDDHSLGNQRFAPFEERVGACTAAVQRANRETGYACVYVPNVTGSAAGLNRRARFARDAGAGGLMLAPGLLGWDLVREVAEDDALALPILAHPTFHSALTTNARNGISPYVLFGQLTRLVGADVSIFGSFGGRFPITRAACRTIAEGTSAPLGRLLPNFPSPGGGMTLDRLNDLLEVYGREVVLLIGGGLHTHSPELLANCRLFRRLVEQR